VWRIEGWTSGLLFAMALAAGWTAPAGAVVGAGNPPFYEVYGRRYHVLGTSHGFRERGVASWYGRGFHGRSTANGEVYDMYALTAAHRTLPIPTYVEVTNLRNRKKVIVRVNDRGPFLGGRIIDLSYAAARALDLVDVGTGMVEIRSLTAGRRSSRPIAAAGQPVFLQVGAYAERSNAQRLRRRLEASGFDNVVLTESLVEGRRMVRVRLGPIPDDGAYDRLVERLAAIGVDDTLPVTGSAPVEREGIRGVGLARAGAVAVTCGGLSPCPSTSREPPCLSSSRSVPRGRGRGAVD
jgi:rare lipoprotein A